MQSAVSLTLANARLSLSLLRMRTKVSWVPKVRLQPAVRRMRKAWVTARCPSSLRGPVSTARAPSARLSSLALFERGARAAEVSPCPRASKRRGRSGRETPKEDWVGAGLPRAASQRRAAQRPPRPRPRSCPLPSRRGKGGGRDLAAANQLWRSEKAGKSGTKRRRRWRRRPGAKGGRRKRPPPGAEPRAGLEPLDGGAQQAAPSIPAPASRGPRSRAPAMHIPESLQDLADSEAVQFLKRPKTITRIFAGVFSLVVFSSLLTDGHQNNTESSRLRCVLNGNSTACGFAVGAGLLAFLTCLAFLALDTHESRIGSSRFKTAFQLLDFILAVPPVLWTGIWFVGFCFLANQWQHSPPEGLFLGSSSAKAAITFTFFSVLVWAFQAYLALQDLRNDAPVPYKRSLDEGGVALTTLSPPSAASPVNTPPAGPNSLNYASSALSPYLATPKAPRLAMMPDN